MLNYFYEESGKVKLLAIFNQKTIQFAQTQGYFKKITTDYPSIDPNDLKNSLLHLQQELSVQTSAVNLIMINLHFSSYLTGLAQSIVPGVWLTHFNFSATDHPVTLEGYALQPLLVQQFLDKLQHNAIFSGMSFELGELSQKPIENTKAISFNITTNPIKSL
jgi:hypothetical protein